MFNQITDFVNWHRRRNPQARTWRDYSYDLKQFVEVVGNRDPLTITVTDIDRFVKAQFKRGLSPKTINRRLTTIVSFYTHLSDTDPQIACPVLPHRHFLKERKRLPRPVPSSELKRFFRAIDNTRDRAMFVLMLRCGLRISEVASLRLEMRTFQATLRFLQEHDILVPQSILAMRGLKEKDPLPRFLTDEAVGKLRDYFEERVQTIHSPARSRDAHLDRATFYLMWQAGLRLGEVEDLELEDVNLEEKQVRVKAGKGIEERIVYLSDNARAALESYLKVRGQALANHQQYFFIYRFKRADRRMIGKRLSTAGKKVGVKVTPHRLRHTFATQLVNAGCPITTIQRLMGHRRLTSTLVYARVHDKTVAEDYFTAMAVIEGRMNDDNDETESETPLDWLARLVSEQLTPEQEDALTRLSVYLVERAVVEKGSSPPTGLPPPQRGGN